MSSPATRGPRPPATWRNDRPEMRPAVRVTVRVIAYTPPRPAGIVMAAAPADFTVSDTSNEKLSRTGGDFTLTLVPTEDILAGLSANRIEGQTVVGFAAQHGGDAIGRARQKLERKGADLIVLNDVSDRTIGFDSSENAVTLVTVDDEREIAKAPKTEIADRIIDRAIELRSGA